MPSLDVPRPEDSAAGRALNRILKEERFTTTELADVAGCCERHIQKHAAGQGHLNDLKAERIARYLCEHGETRYSKAFICTRYALVPQVFGTANGSVQDEIVQLVKAGAMLDEGMSERSPETIDGAIALIDRVKADLIAERNAL